MTWEADIFPGLTCCQHATAQEVEEEPEAFNCEDCQWRLWQDRLGPELRQALTLHTVLASRVVRDLRLAPLVFDAFGLTMTRDEALRLVEYLRVIHDARRPPPSREVPLELLGG